MDLKISGKLALVTGCSRGIGKAIAQSLAEEGVHLILVSRNATELEKLKSQLPNPSFHEIIAIDLTESDAPERLVKGVEKIGDLDIVVNNLGGSLGISDPLAPATDWEKVWHFNLGIPIEINRLVIPKMVKSKWGRIVHMSTLGAFNFKGNAAYASAKSALNAYVKSVSREFAKNNVIVSAVAPSAVYIEGRYLARLKTENPEALEDYFKNNQKIGRLAQTEEIAAVVAFLCSEKASFMAGSIVGVDGAGM
jgi:3-oxoacyl-[acyl-carrier protein] reductase